MANLNDVTIRRNNMVIVELFKDERGRVLDEIRKEDTIKVPLVITLTPNNDKDFFGDVKILSSDADESKTLYSADITCISLDEEYVSGQAVRIGVKEILNKFKSEKVNIDCIYLVQQECITPLTMVEIGLSIQEILVDNKLTDKVRLWVENLAETMDEEEVVVIEEKPKKKKDKKNKDKKKKKKGKKK